jgi:hypothetical protein
VVSESGSVAWVASESRRGGLDEPSLVRVLLAPVGEPLRTLDEGPDIGPESLSLTGVALSWWHAGTLRTAPMP